MIYSTSIIRSEIIIDLKKEHSKVLSNFSTKRESL